MAKTYSAAVIGSTGKGGYGHRLDTAFAIDDVELIAIADHDPEGLADAGERLGVSRLYRDYRQMLETEKPDFVSIAPSWVTERVPMIEAAAAAGCHIYCEKPVAGSLAEVDTIVAACQSAKVKMAVAHQWRAMLPIQKIIEAVKAGKFGKLLRVRTRPKDDSRGGGEELLLHGTHLFDLMMAFTGEPRWASGHVTVDGRDATTDDTGEGNAPSVPSSVILSPQYSASMTVFGGSSSPPPVWLSPANQILITSTDCLSNASAPRSNSANRAMSTSIPHHGCCPTFRILLGNGSGSRSGMSALNIRRRCSERTGYQSATEPSLVT